MRSVDKLSHDLFLLMLNLSQMQDVERIRNLFIEAINANDLPIHLHYREDGEEIGAPGEEIATRNSSFGFLEFRGDPEELPEEAMPVLRNSVRLLALVLENRTQAELLRQEKEKLARSLEERDELMLQTAIDGFWVVDMEGRIVEVNEAYCRMVGYSREELLTMGVADLEAIETEVDVEQHIHGIRRAGGQRFESVHRAKDGTLTPVEVSANYLNQDGGRVYSFFRDITERNRAQEEKLALERQMQHAQKLESLGLLAGGIAHDFNNILMSILGHADLALHKVSRISPAHHNLVEIEKAARRAADLARQMLAYSGRGQFVIERLDGNELVREMGHLLKVSISKRAVLRLKLASQLPGVDGDGAQVGQVVMNLITNASEAIGEEEGVIVLRTGERDCDRAYLDATSDVLLAAQEEPVPPGHYVFIEVADTGCGMDEETMARIFDPFFTTKFTGRGLGMSAVLGIVRGHRGAIKIESELGRGSTFTILLPAAAESARPAGSPSPEAETWRGEGTFLVVDDEDSVRNVATQMLERLGFSVLQAADGGEAIEVFHRCRAEITGVLLDLTMPRKGGAETFHELRELDPDVRVILCSGFNESDATTQLSEAGLAGFIQKPFDLATLRATLKQALPTG